MKLTDVQKTHLLHIALCPSEQGEPADEDEAKGDLLCDILRCRLPLPAGTRQGLAVAAPVVAEVFRSIHSAPLGELLLDAQVSTAALRDVKEYAKALGSTANSDREKDVYLTVYFGAIAAAMVFHGERITEHSERDLAQFFHSFACMPWVVVRMADLFRRAAQVLSRLNHGV